MDVCVQRKRFGQCSFAPSLQKAAVQSRFHITLISIHLLMLKLSSAKTVCTMLVCVIVIAIQGCATPAKQAKFDYASCTDVVPFSKKSLPSPALKGAQCGLLTVPENRSKHRSEHNKKTIQLAVVIIPSVVEPRAPDPVVYLAGGPGGSAFLEIESLVNDGINRNRDLILMSQRGTLFSKPELMCAELDTFYVDSLAIPLDSEANRKEHIIASQACYLRLLKQGIDLNAYNTVESAADFADLRTALGIPKWNVLGVSYGTYLAQTLMYQHPAGIRSVTLDSVVPIEDGKAAASAAKNAREGFDHLFAACAAQPACADHYPNLATTFTNLVNELESKPVEKNTRLTSDGAPTKIGIDGGVLVNWLINESFNTPNYPNVPALINSPDNDADRKIIGSYALPFMIPANVLAYGMTMGMVCSGYLADEDESDILKQGRRAFPEYPDSVLAPALHFSYVYDDCRVWNIAKTPKKLRTAKSSSIPTLIISGTFDAVTPPSTGVIAAKTLSDSHVLTFPGVGHGVVNASSCAQNVFASFLANPDKPDTTCVTQLAVPVFEVGNKTSNKTGNKTSK
jgi:pimeloyl-ACP methyl ester carboxylesterase